MKKKLVSKNKLYHCTEAGRVEGPNPNISDVNSDLWGDCSGLRGDCSYLNGDCSGLRGDCSGLKGNCSGVKGDCTQVCGDLDECEITKEERERS